MGHRVERIESVQRAETSRELIADAVALVDKWNVDIERRKDFPSFFRGRTNNTVPSGTMQR